MAINQILQFGAGAGANVMTPADYSALAARSSGFQSGVAKSKEVNTPIRQSAFVAAMIGQFIANTAGIDVLDDGDLSGLEADFKASLKGLLPGRLMTSKTFISSGTYTPTPGTKFARFKGVAAGGGSGGTLATAASQAAASGAGGAGNHFDFLMYVDTISSIPITIGAAGAAGTSAPTNGGNGGDLLIGSYATIKGGRGGAAGNAIQTFPGLGGVCLGNEASTISGGGVFGVLDGQGQSGVRGIVLGIVNLVYSLGGNSAWGRGGTLDGSPGIGGGAVGAGVGQNVPASAGFQGGPGILIVEEYA